MGFKISVVTAARSEYGLLRWLMHEIKEDADFEMQLIVTGAHLAPDFDYTCTEIEKDGFVIDAKVDMELATATTADIARSMGRCMIGMGNVFEKLQPDLVVVLGDRYELLPICSTALVMNIPIAHISGGDLTEGAIDNQVRHAITKMANIHFPGTQESAKRIMQMGEDPSTIFVAGEPGLDNFKRLKMHGRADLAKALHMPQDKKWVLLTYHPETLTSKEENLAVAKNIIFILSEMPDVVTLITASNADHGGQELNLFFKKVEKENPGKFHFFKSLGQLNYLSVMKEAWCLVGNSSSAIVEAPAVPVPAINIGKRQSGRIMLEHVINIKGTVSELREALDRVQSDTFRIGLTKIRNPYGNGDTAIRIKNILKHSKGSISTKKSFYAL